MPRTLRNAMALSWLLLAATLASAGEKGLVGHWLFERAHIADGKVRDLAGGRHAAISGKIAFASGPEALVLDGETNSVVIAPEGAPSGLPKRDLSVEAWVAIDAPLEWGGIIGFLEDNGNFEKGWLLGSRNNRFCFAVSTAGADDGDGRLTYLQSRTTFEPGRWYHMAGTYDGKVQSIYVNGKLEDTSRDQSGDIVYPKSSFYELGAYHDSNEHYRYRGKLREVRVYGRALAAAEVAAHWKAGAGLLPRPLELAAGPTLRPVPPDSMTIAWEMSQGGPAIIEYGESEPLAESARDDSSGTAKKVTLTGLRPNTIYTYRVVRPGKGGGASKTYYFDATFTGRAHPVSDGPSPYPADALSPLYAAAARQIVETTGVRQGFCLVLGCGEGRLALELARLTKLTIVGIEEDGARVAAARRALAKAGANGTRVSVHDGSLSALPFPSCFASLVVSDATMASGALPGDAREVRRVVRPCGGVAWIGQPAGFAKHGTKLAATALKQWLGQEKGWKLDEREGLRAVFRRGALPGAGEWTHIYADAANTACSGESGVAPPLRVQWFGRPGPRLMVDRHHRAVPPLYRDGRLFVPANNRILAIDAYSGTQLWDVGFGESTRLGAPKDSGFMALAPDLLYVATADECVGLDVATGRRTVAFPTPQPDAERRRGWGYLATVGDLLFGSARKRRASLRKQGRSVVEIQYGDFKDISTSDALFCLNRHTGKRLWSYRGAAILDPAIAVGSGRVYFIESANPQAAEDADGRMKLDVLLGKGSRLVALDARTGATLWKKKADLRGFQHVVHLSFADATLLVLGSRNKDRTVWYDLLAFDAASGALRWRREQNNRVRSGGDHGEQVKHPAIVAGVIYAEPCAYSLKTGEPVEGWRFKRGGHGCGTISTSASAIFYRAGNPTMFDLRTHAATRLTRVSRPGCWINILPAGGMILIPEASSGCTCAYPLQTSLGLMPAAAADRQ